MYNNVKILRSRWSKFLFCDVHSSGFKKFLFLSRCSKLVLTAIVMFNADVKDFIAYKGKLFFLFFIQLNSTVSSSQRLFQRIVTGILKFYWSVILFFVTIHVKF